MNVYDAVLIQAATNLGVHLWQPWRAMSIRFERGMHSCIIQSNGKTEEIHSRVLIAAHGSWEGGGLPTQLKRQKLPSDLLAFKMLFRGAQIDENLMPMLAFPGGYGGMACMEPGLVGMSCCIRRDVLQERRNFYGSSSAAQAVLRHISTTTTPVADALVHAVEADRCLAAGPIRPGMRPCYELGIFRVGNAAGEAHPVIAEGISMALQAGELLAKHLIFSASQSPTSASLEECGQAYSRSWRSLFGLRIRAADLFARLAMTEIGTNLMINSVKTVPNLLTMCATLSGKTKRAG